ncbi:MAG: NAD(P)H-hydrate dehydratase [Clostridiales bacterium]|nr:NAD(P)H-hydrate dehydratase [Clostridiales bacterium]
MKRVLTSVQMREADRYTIEEKGVGAETLMERAGRALADCAESLINGGGVLCVCGGGNNGGDGFVCARILLARGYEVNTVCIATRFSADCENAKGKYLSAGGKLLNDFSDKKYALVIDCLLGTGFHGAISDEYAIAVQKINDYKSSGAKVLSADIPSGVNGDNGEVETLAVCADTTLCIGEYKAGVFLGDGIDYAGEALRADIGIAMLDGVKYVALTEREDVAKLLPKRKRNTHKGSYGKTAIVGGSIEYTGAPYLSTLACLRSGAGYTTLFVPENVLPFYVLKAPEALLKPLHVDEENVFNEENKAEILAYDSVAYGMGMGISEGVANGAKYLLSQYEGKLVLDADALNSLAKYAKEEFTALFANKKCDVVITPHLKEFSRLTGESVAELKKKGLSAPIAFAREHAITVLLKNAVSLIADKEDVFVNISGCAGQAKGGSGDALSGVIASLCAQGLSATESAVAGAYLVGKSAEIASKEQGEYSLTASDCITCLGKAFLSLYD